MNASKYITALYSGGSMHVISDAETLYKLFRSLLVFDQNNLVYRLFVNSVRYSDVTLTIDLLNTLSGHYKDYLCEVLKKIIKSYNHLDELNQICLKRNEPYDPFRFIIFDEPYCTLSCDIPLEDYDNNEGEPFWMRPEYIIEKYGKNTRIQVDTITPTSYEHKATYKDGKLIK